MSNRINRAIVILVLIGALFCSVVLVGQWGYTEWLRFTGQLELRQAEAEAARLQAQAELEKAAADRARAESEKIAAEGDRALAISTGMAVQAPAEAAARTVNRQSAVVTFWEFITPGLFVSLMLVASCLGSIGGPVTIVILYAFGKRYLPELLVGWNVAWEEAKRKHNQNVS